MAVSADTEAFGSKHELTQADRVVGSSCWLLRTLVSAATAVI